MPVTRTIPPSCTFVRPSCAGSRASSEQQKWSCSFPQCDYQTGNKYYIKIHEQTHKEELQLRKPFSCSFANCEYRAPTDSALTRHVQAKHESVKKYECGMCPWTFFTSGNLRSHLGVHVKEKRSECEQCKFTTHSGGSFKRHVKTVHDKNGKFTCTHANCKFITERPENLKRHLQTHEQDPALRRPFPCGLPNCSYRGRSADTVKNHIRIRHNENRRKNIACPLCPQMFFDKDAMHSHVKNIHTKEKDLKCSECDFVTRMSHTLQEHFQRKHGGGYVPARNTKCELCFYLDINRHYIKRHHMKFHEVEPTRQFPFECNVPSCDFRSRTRADISKHERLHQSPKKLLLRCQLCPGNVNPNWDSIRFHQWIAHGRNCHRCSMCSYVARKKFMLKKHVKFHHYDINNRVQAEEKSASSPPEVVQMGNQTPVCGTNEEFTEPKIENTKEEHCLLRKLMLQDDYSVLKLSHVLPVVLLRKLDVEIF